MIECLRTGWGNNAAKLRIVFKRVHVVIAHLFAITEETLSYSPFRPGIEDPWSSTAVLGLECYHVVRHRATGNGT